MRSLQEIQEIGIKAIEKEIDAIKSLVGSVNDQFAKAVSAIIYSSGRVVITGIGKSANIASKVVSTLNSTGTPAIFMHAADAIHGDLGIIQPDDIIICISKSGETSEIKVLVPLIKSRGNKMIAVVGNTSSYLAQQADWMLDTTVKEEACPNNLAPTSSTTAQLVMGDALAIALLECRGFTASDFARYHPGGALGKQLYLRVSDVYKQNKVPRVNTDTGIDKVIVEISSKMLGATAVVDGTDLVGIITDGDLRRMLESSPDFSTITAKDVMTVRPKSIEENAMVVEALGIMRANNITQLPVVLDGEYCGIIHLHDILKEGVV